MRGILLLLLVVPSFAFADVSHPGSATVTACYTDHDDFHFFAFGGICDNDYEFGYVDASGNDCLAYDGAQLVNAGGSHCLIEDSEGNLWSLEKGLGSEAGIGACVSANDFSDDSGCPAAPPVPEAPLVSVPLFGPLGLFAMVIGLVLLGGRKLTVRT